MHKVTLVKKEDVGLITIDSPPMNVLDKEVIDSLEEIIQNVDDSLNVLIIKGAGEKSFVAGADIKEFPELTNETGQAICLRGQAIFNQLANLKQPVIAAIDGFTLGGGLELALACDIRFSSESSIFGLPEVKLGIIPGYGGTQRLPRTIGLGKAKQLLLSGNFISADEAYRIGLIDEVIESIESNVIEEAMKLAKTIASRGPKAVQLAKKVMNEGMDQTLKEGLKFEAETFGKICETEDKKEGVNAFIEKRKPCFMGK